MFRKNVVPLVPPHVLPAFQRKKLKNSLLYSICKRCKSILGFSRSVQVLGIVERSHICPAATTEKRGH